MKRQRVVRTFDGSVSWADMERRLTSEPTRQFIGTGLAILIGSLAAGGASVASGVMASKAQDRATEAQTSAGQAAEQVAKDTLAENRRQFDITQANNWAQYNAAIKNNFDQYAYKQKLLAPYQGLGVSASNTLAQMLHLPIAKVAAPPTPQLPQMQQAPPNAPTFTSMFNGQGAPPQQAPRPAPAGPAGNGGMVMMRAPTGETQAVPAAMAAHYQQAGATMVNA